MKKLIFLIVALVFAVSSSAFAATGAVLDNNSGNDGNILVNTGSKVLGQDVGTWVDPVTVPSLKGATGDQGIQGEQGDKGDQGQAAEERETPAGVGMDLMLWQNPTKSVGIETQYKYDINNDEHSIFGVVKINLWDMFRKNK